MTQSTPPSAKEEVKSPILPMVEEPQKEMPIGAVANIARDTITFVFGLGAFFIIAGYIVVFSYLKQYTSIRTFQVVTPQFIAAGVNLSMFYFAALISTWFLETTFVKSLPHTTARITVRVLFTVIFSILIAILVAMILKSQSQLGFADLFVPLLMQLILAISIGFYIFSGFIGSLSIAEPLPMNMAFIAVALFYAVLGGVGYGSTYYAIPRTYGGGEPIPVILVFNQVDDISATMLSTSNDTETQPVCILVELNNGILVFDPQQQLTVVVKHEMIRTMRDNVSGTVDCRPPRLQRSRNTNQPAPTPTP